MKGFGRLIFSAKELLGLEQKLIEEREFSRVTNCGLMNYLETVMENVQEVSISGKYVDRDRQGKPYERVINLIPTDEAARVKWRYSDSKLSKEGLWLYDRLRSFAVSYEYTGSVLAGQCVCYKYFPRITLISKQKRKGMLCNLNIDQYKVWVDYWTGARRDLKESKVGAVKIKFLKLLI